MAQSIPDQKAALRNQIRECLARLSVEERLSRSSLACSLLREQAVWTKARSILFYAPLPGELDVWPLLRQAIFSGKTAALPRYLAAQDTYIACQVGDPLADVQPARFGIREPIEGCQEIELNRLDLILVPGVAFDLHGRRLGRGRGYYDRLLGAVQGETCGVAFDEQVVGEVPVEAHDAGLNCILTPTRWFEL